MSLQFIIYPSPSTSDFPNEHTGLILQRSTCDALKPWIILNNNWVIACRFGTVLQRGYAYYIFVNTNTGVMLKIATSGQVCSVCQGINWGQTLGTRDKASTQVTDLFSST